MTRTRSPRACVLTCSQCGRLFGSEQALGLHFAWLRRRGSCAPAPATAEHVRLLHVYECALAWRTALRAYGTSTMPDKDGSIAALAVAERLLQAALPNEEAKP